MNLDDGAVAEPSCVSGASAHLEWSDAAEVAREATLRRLHSLVLEKDPLSPDVLGDTMSSCGVRSIDDEPAALVYDSTTDDRLLTCVRSGARTARQLTFEAEDLVLEMEVSGARYLVGQVVPPQVALIELRHRVGTTPVETDELGCFHFPAVPDGPVSFRCRPTRPDARPVATSWITL
ncbi:MAG: hypothetical protein ABSA65_06320 [Acidimicrobiales bacterium]|jgi:hypothetical protein